MLCLLGGTAPGVLVSTNMKLCFSVKGSTATSLTDKIYYDLNSDGFAMCFRRFNATHQIGCSCKWLCLSLSLSV